MTAITQSSSPAVTANSTGALVVPPQASQDLKDLAAQVNGMVSGSNLPPEMKRAVQLMIRLALPIDEQPGDMDLLLSELDEILFGANVAVGKERIKLTETAIKENLQKAKEAFDAAAAAAKAASEKAGTSDAMGWLGVVASVIGAGLSIVAAVASGGAAIGVAVLAVALAVQQITDMSLKSANGGEGVPITNVNGDEIKLGVGFGEMVDAAVEQQIQHGTIVVIRQNNAGDYLDKDGKKLGYDPHDKARPGTMFKTEDELADWKRDWTYASTGIVMAVMIGAAVGPALASAIRGAGKAAEAAGKAADGVTKVARTASSLKLELYAEVGAVGMTFVETGSGIVKASVDLAIAIVKRAGDLAEAEKEYRDAKVKDAKGSRQLSLEWLRQTFERNTESSEARADNVAANHAAAQKLVIHV